MIPLCLHDESASNELEVGNSKFCEYRNERLQIEDEFMKLCHTNCNVNCIKSI